MAQPGKQTGALKDFVIISGLSGAGKSSVMNIFEDAGYFCVDNLPADMIRALSQLFRHSGSKVERAAVVSDLRGGEYFEGLAGVLDELKSEGINHNVIFLYADEDALLKRYQETRRRHPLSPSGMIIDGIRREQELLAPIRERADLLIDTTDLNASTLRHNLTAELLDSNSRQKLALTFLSFGHKYGPWRDADIVFDVRFLNNPHYDLELRPLTGFDQKVVKYVAKDGRLDQFYAHVVPLLDFLLPQFVAEGKTHLTIAVGCTGGRHRSVAVVEYLGKMYSANGTYSVQIRHRDVDRSVSK